MKRTQSTTHSRGQVTLELLFAFAAFLLFIGVFISLENSTRFKLGASSELQMLSMRAEQVAFAKDLHAVQKRTSFAFDLVDCRPMETYVACKNESNTVRTSILGELNASNSRLEPS
ncbi:MAG: hypothetical protein ABIH99_06020 [Candidatus Micrarchaeota archaeon]